MAAGKLVKHQRKAPVKVIKKVVSKILRNRGLRPELKTFNTKVQDSTLARAGVLLDLVNVSQGDAPYQRNGNRILVTKIEIAYQVSSQPEVTSSTAATDTFKAFCALLIDKESNGATPTELYSEPDASQAGSEAPFIAASTASNIGGLLSMRNTWMNKRYRYLSEQNVHIMPSANWNFKAADTDFQIVATSRTYRMVKTFKTPIEIVYDGPDGLIASVQKNNFLFTIAPSENETMILDFASRITYTDL